MHTVATDEVQVRITVVQLLADGSDVPCVIVVVNGIRLFLANNAAIYEVPFPGQPDLNQLSLGELNQVAIARVPESVVLKAEVFETVTNLIWFGHHLRRPRAEVLNTTDFDAWIVNVDPVVIKHVSVFQDQHDGEEIAILKAFGCALRSLAH